MEYCKVEKEPNPSVEFPKYMYHHPGVDPSNELNFISKKNSQMKPYFSTCQTSDVQYFTLFIEVIGALTI